MNDSQRLIKLVLIAIGAFVVLFGGFMFVNKIFSGLNDQDALLERLQDEQNDLTRKLALLAKARRELNNWQSISMPADPVVAFNRYYELLIHLITKHELTLKSQPDLNRRVAVTANNKANLVPLTFQVDAEGTYPQFLAFLKEFYQLNMPHSIRELSITAASAGSDAKLDFKFKIEAIIVNGASNRNFLVAVPDRRLVVFDIVSAMKRMPFSMTMAAQVIMPTGLYGKNKLAAEFNSERHYEQLSKKNIFAGLTSPEAAVKATPLAPDRSVLKEVVLTSITANLVATEASLRNRLTNRFIRIRNEPPLNEFEIKDENNQLVLKGKVISINPPQRTVVIQVDGKHYALHLGQFLNQALEKEMKPEEIKSMVIETSMESDYE